MQNLKQDGTKSFEYQHIGPKVADEELRGFREGSEYFHAVDIEFKYDRAGTSMWTYQSYPGGIYVKFRPVKVEMNNGRKVSTMFSIDASDDPNKTGFSVFLVPLERGNPTKLRQLSEFFDPLVPDLGKMWFEQGAVAVRDRLKDACVSFQNNHKLGSLMVWPKKEVQPQPVLEAAAG